MKGEREEEHIEGGSRHNRTSSDAGRLIDMHAASESARFIKQRQEEWEGKGAGGSNTEASGAEQQEPAAAAEEEPGEEDGDADGGATSRASITDAQEGHAADGVEEADGDEGAREGLPGPTPGLYNVYMTDQFKRKGAANAQRVAEQTVKKASDGQLYYHGFKLEVACKPDGSPIIKEKMDKRGVNHIAVR